MILLLLFAEFFKVGLFSVGGGLATLPFLYQLADKYDWL
ncbi:MAG: chromate transporter, partial [Treponema sp.]|nr:chromate transporter [Treponema sp.]